MQPLAPRPLPSLAGINAMTSVIHEQMERLKTNDERHSTEIRSLKESYVVMKQHMTGVEERLAVIDTRSAGSIEAIQGLSRSVSGLVQHVDKLKPPASLSIAAFCPPPIITHPFTSVDGDTISEFGRGVTTGIYSAPLTSGSAVAGPSTSVGSAGSSTFSRGKASPSSRISSVSGSVVERVSGTSGKKGRQAK
jgi:hypothetical protein